MNSSQKDFYKQMTTAMLSNPNFMAELKKDEFNSTEVANYVDFIAKTLATKHV